MKLLVGGAIVASAIGMSGCQTSPWDSLMSQTCFRRCASVTQLLMPSDPVVTAMQVDAGEGVSSSALSSLGDAARQQVWVSTRWALDQEVPADSPLRAKDGAVKAVDPAAPSVTWTSPANPATPSGKTTLLQVVPDSAGGECRVVRQLVVIDGVEALEDVKYCRPGPQGAWSVKE